MVDPRDTRHPRPPQPEDPADPADPRYTAAPEHRADEPRPHQTVIDNSGRGGRPGALTIGVIAAAIVVAILVFMNWTPAEAPTDPGGAAVEDGAAPATDATEEPAAAGDTGDAAAPADDGADTAPADDAAPADDTAPADDGADAAPADEGTTTETAPAE